MSKLSKTQKTLIIVFVCIAVTAAAFYIFHVWFTFRYGSGRHKVPAHILEIDKNFNFPKNFSPDPGEAGKKTIEGIDADRNGVRDDVQRWIYAFVPNEPKKQMALIQLARYYQDTLQEEFGSEARKANLLLLDRSDQCVDKSFDDELHGYVESEYLKAKVLNTYDRTERYLENDRKFTVEEARTPVKKDPHPCETR